MQLPPHPTLINTWQCCTVKNLVLKYLREKQFIMRAETERHLMKPRNRMWEFQLYFILFCTIQKAKARRYSWIIYTLFPYSSGRMKPNEWVRRPGMYPVAKSASADRRGPRGSSASTRQKRVPAENNPPPPFRPLANIATNTYVTLQRSDRAATMFSIQNPAPT